MGRESGLNPAEAIETNYRGITDRVDVIEAIEAAETCQLPPGGEIGGTAGGPRTTTQTPTITAQSLLNHAGGVYATSFLTVTEDGSHITLENVARSRIGAGGTTASSVAGNGEPASGHRPIELLRPIAKPWPPIQASRTASAEVRQHHPPKASKSFNAAPAAASFPSLPRSIRNVVLTSAGQANRARGVGHLSLPSRPHPGDLLFPGDHHPPSSCSAPSASWLTLGYKPINVLTRLALIV